MGLIWFRRQTTARFAVRASVIYLHFPATWSDRRDLSLDFIGLKSYSDDLQRFVGPYLHAYFSNANCVG